MFDKINISKIVKDHISTLEDNSTGQKSRSDIFLFFFFPIIPALLIILYKGALDTNMVNILVTSMSVFAALLFNLLLLIYDIVRKNICTNSQARNEVKVSFLRQIYSNISFCIFISILTLLMSLSNFMAQGVPILMTAIAFIVYYLVIVFILTLFMILKRVHVLLSHEFG